MKVSEMWGGENQDQKIEHLQKVFDFRTVVFDYAKKSKNQEAMNLASVLVHALFGAAHNYKPCCVLEFCENTFFEIQKPISLCPVDKRVLCKKCEKEWQVEDA